MHAITRVTVYALRTYAFAGVFEVAHALNPHRIYPPLGFEGGMGGRCVVVWVH